MQSCLAKPDLQHKPTIITTNRMLRPIPTKPPQLGNARAINPIANIRFGVIALQNLIQCLASSHTRVLPNEKS